MDIVLRIIAVLLCVGGVLLALPFTRIIGGLLMLICAFAVFVYLAFKPKGNAKT